MKRMLRICIWLWAGQIVVGVVAGAVVGVLYKDDVLAFARCAAIHADKLTALGSCI